MSQFTIRVYGIWIDEENRILLSDERIGNMQFTKFPGGGLEFGEGTIDCLKREWIEELNTPIEVVSHLYTTDFFQASAFHRNTQVISIYYRVRPIEPPGIQYDEFPFSFHGEGHEEVRFRQIPLPQFHPDALSFPIDKRVAELLCHQLKTSS
jgi:8-oxo-dGTP pyrophosphatase MutT (NUDIX family)